MFRDPDWGWWLVGKHWTSLVCASFHFSSCERRGDVISVATQTWLISVRDCRRFDTCNFLLPAVGEKEIPPRLKLVWFQQRLSVDRDKATVLFLTRGIHLTRRDHLVWTYGIWNSIGQNFQQKIKRNTKVNDEIKDNRDMQVVRYLFRVYIFTRRFSCISMIIEIISFFFFTGIESFLAELQSWMRGEKEGNLNLLFVKCGFKKEYSKSVQSWIYSKFIQRK